MPTVRSLLACWGILGGSTCKEKTARGGDRPPGHDRCSFGSKRCTPASNTLAPKGGARQGSTGAPKVPQSSAWRMLVGAARHLCPQLTGGHADSALVLPGIAHHLQPVARLSGCTAAGNPHRARGGCCRSRAVKQSDGGRRSGAQRRCRAARGDALGAPARTPGAARSEAGDRPVAAAVVRLPSRGHRLSPAPRQRCGVGIATLADCPLAPRCGRAARFPPPRHRSCASHQAHSTQPGA